MVSNIITKTYSHSSTNMTMTKAELKGPVKKTVKVKQDHLTLSIMAAMRVTKFTYQESANHTS